MQNDYLLRIMCKRPKQATAIGAQHQSNGIVATVGYALMTAITVLWAAQLPSMTGTILSQLNTVPNGPAVFNSTVNRENKGDRLLVTTFDDRWNALGKVDTLRPTAKIPAPCGIGAPCGGGASLHIKIAFAK